MTLGLNLMTGTTIKPIRSHCMATAEGKLEEWRHLAADLRADAARTTMPGFADRLIHAAEDLERYAEELRKTDSAAFRTPH